MDASPLTPAPDQKSASFSSNITGSARIRASVNSLTSIDSGTITVNPRPASQATTTITPARPGLFNDGTDNTTVTVQLKDQYGNNLSSNIGNNTVALSINTGSQSSLSAVTDNNDGTFTATLTSGSTLETVTISGTLNGNPISDSTSVVITDTNTWVSQASGAADPTSWEEGANWSLGIAPVSNHPTVIPTNPANANNFPVIQSDPTITSLEIQSGASVNVGAGFSLTVSNDITGGGSLIGDNSVFTVQGNVSVGLFTAGTSNVTLNGSSGQTINAMSAAKNLSISNTSAGGVTLNSAIDISQTLSISNGATLTAQSDLSGADISANGANIKLEGNLDFAGVSAAPSAVEFTGGNKQQMINFDTFNDLTINKTANSVQATGDLIVNGTLSLTSGDLIMGSGTNLIAPNRTLPGGTIKFQLELPSSGWYALSSPAASTYADLLDSVVTQGYPGAFYSTGSLPGDTLQPNVLYYDETYAGTDNQRWRTLASASDSTVESRGHFVYVFGDVPGDTRYNRAAPNTLEVTGTEFQGNGSSVDFNITHTALADTGWNLIGNPFAATINWDDDTRWTKTNVDNTIYVWDHSANGGNGEYLVWNGFTGSMGNGLLAPFQAFWVKANADNPALTVSKNAKTTGGIYRKTLARKKSSEKEKETPPVVQLRLESGKLSYSSYLSFSENGSLRKDPQDAYFLTPFTDTFVKVSTKLNDGTHLAINNLPRRFGKELKIPLHVGGLENGKFLEGTYTLSWPDLKHIPAAWTILLEDRNTEKVVNLKRENFYSFDVKLTGQKTSANAYPDGQYRVSSKSEDHEARFVLRISPGADAAGLPRQVTLNQNYPNPFNQATTIVFGLPVETETKLSIYDILGRKVTVLADDYFEAGYHPVNWNPRVLASGVYLFVLQTEEKVLSKKMTFIK